MNSDGHHTHIDVAPKTAAQPSSPPMSLSAPAVTATTMPLHRQVSPTDAVHLTFTSIRRQNKTRITSLDTIYRHPQQEQAFRHRTTVTISEAESNIQHALSEHFLEKVIPAATAVANDHSEGKSHSDGVGLGIEVADAAEAERQSCTPESRERNSRGVEEDQGGRPRPAQRLPEEEDYRRLHSHQQQDRNRDEHAHPLVSTASDSLHYHHRNSQRYGWSSDPASPISGTSFQSNRTQPASPSSYYRYSHQPPQLSYSPHSHYGAAPKDHERYSPYGPPPPHHHPKFILPLKQSSSVPQHEDHGHGFEHDVMLLKRWQANATDNDISTNPHPHHHVPPHHLGNLPPTSSQRVANAHQLPSSSHRGRSVASGTQEDYLSQEPFLTGYHYRGRPDYESKERDQQHFHVQERDREARAMQGYDRGDEERWQQLRVRDRRKEFMPRGAVEPLPPGSNSTIRQGTSVPRLQILSSLSHGQHHSQHHPGPTLPHMHVVPVREDTIPSGVSTARLLTDRVEHTVKEESGSRDANGLNHHTQRSQEVASPHAHSSSTTPQEQPSPSLSACTPPASAQGIVGTVTDPSRKMMLPPTSGTIGSAYTSSSRKPRPYPCTYPGCGRVFEKRCNMLSHHWTHFPAEMPRHPCPTCGKSFTRMHDVQRHISTVHEGSRNFVCAGCRRAFARRNGLNRHQQQSELCRGAGVLTPAEAAAIGGLPPAAARGPRGRKPPLHVSASTSAIATTTMMSHLSNGSDGGYPDTSGSVDASDLLRPLPSSQPLGPISSDSAATFPGTFSGNTEDRKLYERTSGGSYQAFSEVEQRQSHERASDGGYELDDEGDQEADDMYDDDEVDQLQDDRDDDSEEEVDQLADEIF